MAYAQNLPPPPFYPQSHPHSGFHPPSQSLSLAQLSLSRRNSPPSDPSSPVIMPPNAPMWGGSNGEWSHQARNGVMLSSPLGMGHPHAGGLRRPLGDVASNQMPALGLASPFVPSDINTLWGPPLAMQNPEQRRVSLEKELAAAQRKIRDLILENQHLKQREAIRYHSPSPPSITGMSPGTFHTPGPLSTQGSYFDTIGSSLNYSVYSGLALENTPGYLKADSTGQSSRSSVDENGVYRPSQSLIDKVIHGNFSFSNMKDSQIHSVVWVIAHEPSSSNSPESSSLKLAVSNLAGRFVNGNSNPTCISLINAIFAEAKNLCFTSCGNYLCQQLLEKADMPDKLKFIEIIRDDIVPIAGDKFGTHVLCKGIAIKELEEPISEALLEYGVFDSLKTGARRLWREYMERCRQAGVEDIFHRINEDMKGRWAELACTNEHGSIAVQQVFELFGSQELTNPCYEDICANISMVANNQYGHFLITKLLGGAQHLLKSTSQALVSAYPPVALTHHGVNFVKVGLQETDRVGLVCYVDAICSSENGQTPGVVSIATTSVGKAHLIYVIGFLSPLEHNRIRQVCKAYSTTLRNSQSGNDLLRFLGLIHAVGARYRSGSN